MRKLRIDESVRFNKIVRSGQHADLFGRIKSDCDVWAQQITGVNIDKDLEDVI